MKHNITYNLIQTKEGTDTIIVSTHGKEIALHSRIAPTRDARLFKEFPDPKKFDLLIVIGTGLGYHLLSLEKNIEQFNRIVLIDILPGIKEAITGNKTTQFLTEAPTVTILSGLKDEEVAARLAELIELETIKGISVLEHPASVRTFPDYYRRIKKSIEHLLNRKAGNLATRKAFGLRYLKNIVQNAQHLDHYRPVASLFNKFTTFPSLVITSGTTLDSAIPFLRDIQKYCFIIAVDSAMPVLVNNGIRPDFSVSIDPQAYIHEHYQGTKQVNTIPVLSISTHPLLLRHKSGLLSLNSHPLSQLADTVYTEGIGEIDSGTGSVAGDALKFARNLDFSVTGLIGFDFSFDRYAIYARGSAYQRRYALIYQNRFTPIEGRNMSYIRKSCGKVRDAGKQTRKSFIQYRHLTEEWLKGRPEDTIFHINPALPLEGTEEIGLTDFTKRFCQKHLDKSKLLENNLNNTPFLDPAPLCNALKNISKTEMFDRLLEESLGKNYSHISKIKIRKMIDGL